MDARLFIRQFNCLLLAMMFFLSACQSVEQPQYIMPQSLKATSDGVDDNKTLFPMENYPQSVERWVPDSANNHMPIMNQVTQKKYFSRLLEKYYGMGEKGRSPWNARFISSILQNHPEKNRDASIRQSLSPESISWGANFIQHSLRWKDEIRHNSVGAMSKTYFASSRAITVRATLVRALPTEQPAYHNPKLAGEGYPFDYLQMSALQPATPVYILTVSQDKAWRYVISPSVTGWVKSEDIATVGPAFVKQWTTLAMKNVGTFIQQSVSVNQGKQFYFLGRTGTLLPFKKHPSGHYAALIPVRKADGSAMIKSVNLHKDDFTPMPWPMTYSNLAKLMKSMSGQPYGWGNTLFYHDCSSEIRSLMMPFGILLPRNSASQIKSVARMVDLSKKSLEDRLAYLEKQGEAFTTLVYLPGHIMLYIGNTQIGGKTVPMTYQNIWGLRPENNQSRSIIGSSVFFPLLASYPERPELVSLADKKEFKLGFLDPKDDIP